MTVTTDECCVETAAISKAQISIPSLPMRIGKGIPLSAWSFVARVVNWRALKRLERDLERIDDRMLKDIGLDRSEIRRAVHYGRDF